MKTKIYLVTNIDNNPFKVYIGKTKGSRKNNHQLTYGKQITYDYIDEIESLDYKDYGPLECYWIEQFKVWGFEVMNNNEGGGGPSKWSDELLDSEENRLRKEKISNNKERAEKISRATKGIPLTEERKVKLRGPRPHLVGIKRTTPLSKETREKLSKSLKGRPSPRKGTKVGDKQKQGIIEANSRPIIQFDLDGNKIKEFKSQSEASRELNINVCSINNCLRKGFNSTCGGFKWKYK